MRDVSWEGHGWGLSGGQLTFPPIGTVQVGLLGQHQLQNAATALLALLELRKLGYHLPQQAILQGCQEVIWPGRLEVVSSRPFMILDGAHNQEGIDALAQSLRHVLLELEKSKFTFLFGMLHNKELSLLEPYLWRSALSLLQPTPVVYLGWSQGSWWIMCTAARAKR